MYLSRSSLLACLLHLNPLFAVSYDCAYPTDFPETACGFWEIRDSSPAAFSLSPVHESTTPASVKKSILSSSTEDRNCCSREQFSRSYGDQREMALFLLFLNNKDIKAEIWVMSWSYIHSWIARMPLWMYTPKKLPVRLSNWLTTTDLKDAYFGLFSLLLVWWYQYKFKYLYCICLCTIYCVTIYFLWMLLNRLILLFR